MIAKPIVLGLGLAALALGSPTLAAPAPLPAPYKGVYQPQGVDEIGMWREDDESERRLAASPLVLRDEKLTSYVKGVLCEAVGNDRCNAARVYILREPSFNATMSPNGTMRVYTGLLLRVRSEAELAAVLGHEFGHFEHRHGVNGFKSARGATDVLAWAQVLASMSSSYDVRRSYQNLELSVYGSFFRYKRDQEREADLTGLGYLNASQLQPQAASAVWKNLMGEAEASARVRGLKKPNFNAIAFTASHPPDGERATYLSELALPEGASRGDGADRYRAALKPWLPQFLEEQIKLNDFGGSDYLIERLAEDGWTPELWFARGELFRTRGNQRDLANAADFYTKAIEANSNLAPAYRGLGLSLLKLGRTADGQKALRTYLQLSPAASDAGMIKLMVPGGTAQ
ncbi:M48 family metalloprotease [Altererythrobacter aerius]|uniref:M48 family metalloprotease n=1 Tax=Tsuneonella aeria TaxID=1837929 RepID=A0A6I4TDZ0_9SPHN|nr:M48 family metallopeptidase [Tsuneonella aeria]MXO74846.1 M48 family metalloprotease [Tsuneonella aeria]